MNIEILKDKISQDTYDRLSEELKDSELKLADLSTGAYVSTAKHGATEKQLQEAQALLESKNKEYDALKATAGDNAALVKQIDELKADFEKQEQELKSNYEKELKKSAVEMKIIAQYKPKDVADVMPLIDLTKITKDGDTLTGLTEQMEVIQKNKAYFFENTSQSASGVDHGKQSDAGDWERIFSAAGIKKKQ